MATTRCGESSVRDHHRSKEVLMLWGMVIGTVAFGTAVALVLASAQSLSRRRLREAEARRVARDLASR